MRLKPDEADGANKTPPRTPRLPNLTDSDAWRQRSSSRLTLITTDSESQRTASYCGSTGLVRLVSGSETPCAANNSLVASVWSITSGRSPVLTKLTWRTGFRCPRRHVGRTRTCSPSIVASVYLSVCYYLSYLSNPATCCIYEINHYYYFVLDLLHSCQFQQPTENVEIHLGSFEKGQGPFCSTAIAHCESSVTVFR